MLERALKMNSANFLATSHADFIRTECLNHIYGKPAVFILAVPVIQVKTIGGFKPLALACIGGASGERIDGPAPVFDVFGF